MSTHRSTRPGVETVAVDQNEDDSRVYVTTDDGDCESMIAIRPADDDVHRYSTVNVELGNSEYCS